MILKKLLLLQAIVLLFLVSETFSQTTKEAIEIDDLLSLKTVANPRVSPDGKWIAFTVREIDIVKDKNDTRIWMISAKGGEPIPMTGKGYTANSPRWSPDNKYLSFIASRDGGKAQVWTLNRMGGEAEQLTKIKQGVSDYEWSPDGKKLLMLLRDPKPEDLTKDKEDDKKPKPYVIDRLQFKRDYVGYLDRYRTHLYTFTPGDSTATQITFGDFDASSPAWSPDGSSIAFVSNRTEEPDGNTNSDIWIVPAINPGKEKSPFQVTKNENADSAPSWSPDGKYITYTTVTDGDAIWYATEKLAVISASGEEPKILTKELDRNVRNPEFSADGKSIFFILEEQGSTMLASVNPSGGNITRYAKGETTVDDFSVAGGVTAALVGNLLEPSEIYTLQKDNFIKLTNINKEFLEDIKNPSIEKISFKSEDGTDVEGFVVKPVDFDKSKKYPAIVWIHGGPVAQYEHSFHATAQLFAANGYVTLLINPRGSSGYGQEFSQAIFADWGNLDFQDIMAGVDHVIKEGYVDPEKLGVGGWSYGGVLTNHVITKTNRFKGAISGASEALYRTNYGHDHYQLLWEKELGLPWENAEAWERISPFNDVDKITTPTLWIGGSDDWNVPIINSEQMYQAMKRLGVETQLIVYPGEFHGISRPSFVKDRYERYLNWFDTYVK
ncbi:S9 family peptidase [Antarcticibacterium sp. 1MA-6-2]|uniref:S9 family peptidase n=1 Tax=Antarcticibacterium sp. 1MA-6-2 TaxID=2908210 RepID=UPI001F191707|nr:S9 family peptidase [Antarcticibacterium sp. 1MA-6-2]UJH90256.1 S9 family peptidase [Antarcticibacterium sp. 1MA-6-2]